MQVATAPFAAVIQFLRPMSVTTPSKYLLPVSNTVTVHAVRRREKT